MDDADLNSPLSLIEPPSDRELEGLPFLGNVDEALDYDTAR
jgi:hypothetical protein